jgi:acyl-CoA thioester hydrolase
MAVLTGVALLCYLANLYFEDLDAMGVVHNGRYATLLERALAGYWTRAGWPYDPGQPRFAEVLFAVREFAITYHQAITRVGIVRVRFCWRRTKRTHVRPHETRLTQTE